MRYQKEAKALWQSYVPKRGQADTVQGELIRAVEKLRDEAQRNGNVNWKSDHVKLVKYLRETLMSSALFDPPSRGEIEQDLARLLDYEHPETSDEPYDRLTDRIVEWARTQPAPVPRQPDPQLKI
jgi:hypothetical protein